MDKFLKQNRKKKEEEDAASLREIHRDFTRSILESQQKENNEALAEKNAVIAALQKRLEDQEQLRKNEEKLRLEAEAKVAGMDLMFLLFITRTLKSNSFVAQFSLLRIIFIRNFISNKRV